MQRTKNLKKYLTNQIPHTKISVGRFVYFGDEQMYFAQRQMNEEDDYAGI